MNDESYTPSTGTGHGSGGQRLESQANKYSAAKSTAPPANGYGETLSRYLRGTAIRCPTCDDEQPADVWANEGVSSVLLVCHDCSERFDPEDVEVIA